MVACRLSPVASVSCLNTSYLAEPNTQRGLSPAVCGLVGSLVNMEKGSVPLRRQAAAEGVAEVLEALREAEGQARAAHAGMWEYGDPGSDEEDAPPPPPKAWGRK